MSLKITNSADVADAPSRTSLLLQQTFFFQLWQQKIIYPLGSRQCGMVICPRVWKEKRNLFSYPSPHITLSFYPSLTEMIISYPTGRKITRNFPTFLFYSSWVHFPNSSFISSSFLFSPLIQSSQPNLFVWSQKEHWRSGSLVVCRAGLTKCGAPVTRASAGPPR